MRKLYLKQQHSHNLQTATTVRDSDGKAQYLVTGQFGRKNAFIHVYNSIGTLVAEFRQVSYGVLPRFTIKINNKIVASIGLSFGSLLDVIYIRNLNWLISGSLINGTYHAHHRQELLLAVKPARLLGTQYNELRITYFEHEPIFIGIVVILNRWLFNTKPTVLKNILRYPVTLAYQQQTITSHRQPLRKIAKNNQTKS
ncbi:LURP-one-related/scramblase family protein [Periweissella beninensis]|uniref:Uncharacterized protein n=1 Tax=Periweissella beninensis TaxID=504936 RepID=A0ABT0VG73_9LACO|nr:hypothetical protein [Periweissella beninensis]MBM7543646.1 uncharacterized protein YxjI [Periweissella beninensis]MCM2436625.1 hypothetical protein [Periweissella beninensis]MCT4395595.1 hypothetical protein [Periweissella beninensis]